MKIYLLKTRKKILELLEEVSHLLGRSSDVFLTSLRALVPAFSGLTRIPRCCCSPTYFRMGWRMGCFLVP